MKNTRTRYDIESKLLPFLDSGEILDVDVSDDLRISFKFGEDRDIGLVLDKIVNRLKRRYPYIYLYNDRLKIALKDRGNTYISYSFKDKIDKFLKEHLTGLNEYTTPKYPDSIFYGKSKETCVLEYDQKNEYLYYSSYNIYSVFHKAIPLETSVMNRIIEKYVVDTLQIRVTDTTGIWDFEGNTPEIN